MSRLRSIAAPFVVAPPSGTRVRTRLAVSNTDALVLWQLGAYLSSLAGADLAKRCGEGRLDAGRQASSRQRRKQQLTKRSSSRWAGAITRTSDDAWALAERNLKAEQVSLRARIKKIARRLAVPAGGRAGSARGYASRAERWQKQRRLQVLQARLDEVDSRLAEGRVSVCRGGRRLAVARHNLDAAGITEEEWLERWRAERLFITADGEADKNLGNETIRWNPAEGWLEIRLPSALAHLASRPHGRYRLSVQQFSVDVSGHHAAALVIGRRGLGQRARRRARCDSTPPEDGRQRATGSAMRPTPTMVGLTQTRDRNSVDREAQGRSQQDKTRPANRASPPIQATQHRSGPPTGVGPPLLRV